MCLDFGLLVRQRKQHEEVTGVLFILTAFDKKLQIYQ